MKKLAIALFALILLTVLAACGSNDTSTPSGEDSESSSSEARREITVGGNTTLRSNKYFQKLLRFI